MASTSCYTDRPHWQQEQDALFAQWPIVAAHSSEVPIGSALPFDALGVPIVVTFRLIEETVFQQEDIAAAVAIQRGLHSGANTALHVGRLEHEVLRFHRNIAAAIDRTLVPG